MISIVIVGEKTVIANLGRVFGRVRLSMEKTIGRLVMGLAKHVKADKLSGQVLNVRTGRLRRSIHSSVTADDVHIVGKVGTDVEYAAFHEYGFKGTVSVKEHLRRTKAQMQTARRMKASEYTSKREGETIVRAHTRQVDYPAHSFLRSALKDMEGKIRTDLAAAAQTGAREAMRA